MQRASATVSAPARIEDHRTRVGADRREKTRMRLIESAMLVFAEHGAEGSVIDEVIRTAGTSRGTFYNYFRSNVELLGAVAEEVGNQMMSIVDPIVRLHADPAARVATGVRSTLIVAGAHPHLAAFMVRVGPPAVDAQTLAREYLSRDIEAGIAAGRFFPMPRRLAFDLVTGPVLAGFHTLLTARVPVSYPQDMAHSILLSLGVPRASARKLANLPIGELAIPPESLLVRAELRAARMSLAGGRDPTLKYRPRPAR